MSIDSDKELYEKKRDIYIDGAELWVRRKRGIRNLFWNKCMPLSYNNLSLIIETKVFVTSSSKEVETWM